MLLGDSEMLGIIGGTGLYNIAEMSLVSSQKITTPFGEPSSEILTGEFAGNRVAFLPRHGTQHQLLPSEINYRANIWALKSIGVTQIISVSATGSLRQEIQPGNLALPDQYVDWTRGRRIGTFFGTGLVGHVSTAHPTCPSLAKTILANAHELGIEIHNAKTYACVEGPRLGTKAESAFLRQSGCDLVGMTNVPEVFLAREAQICYCTIAVATDYDCWLDDPSQHASVDKIMALYKMNIDRVQSILKSVIQTVKPSNECSCRQSVKHALLTQESSLSVENRDLLEVLRR